MVSESGEIVARLLAGGANYQTIGEALGVNRSLPRQWATGAKPGNNMRAALRALERRLGGEEPPPRGEPIPEARAVERRTTRSGALARVRKPTTIRGRSWTASTVKRAGVKGGARGLGHPIADAAEDGRRLGATVSVDKQLSVQAYGTSRRGRAGAGGSVDLDLGDAAEVWDELQGRYGGDVTAYLADQLAGRGLLSGPGMDNAAAHLTEIELRTFD